MTTTREQPSLSHPPSAEALALAVAQRLYGFRPTAAVPLGSESNSVWRVEFGGLPAKVVKLGGSIAGLLREQRVIRRLRRGRWGMPVPAIEFTQEDLPPRWDAGGQTWSRPAAVTVMRLTEGMPLADAVLRGEPWAGEAVREAGALAARLAEVPPTVVGGRLSKSQQQVARAIRWVEPVIEQLGQSRLRRKLELVADLKRRRATSLVHGELYAANVLVTPPAAPASGAAQPSAGDSTMAGSLRLCMLDWETARPGFPLADLAALVTSLADLPIAFPGQLAWLRRRAVDGYAALRELDEADQRELGAWECFETLQLARLHLDHGRPQRAARLTSNLRIDE